MFICKNSSGGMRDWMLYARDVEANAMEHFRWGEPVSVTRTTSDRPSELAQCTATSGENATNQNKLKMKEKIHLLFFFRPNRSFFTFGWRVKLWELEWCERCVREMRCLINTTNEHFENYFAKIFSSAFSSSNLIVFICINVWRENLEIFQSDVDVRCTFDKQ